MNSTFCLKRNPLVIKTFLSILVPTILMNLTTAIGSMADTVIIGQYLDDLSLSVVTYATPIYMVINMLAALFAVGGCIAMSVDMGKGDKKAANRSFSISIEYLTVTSVILFLAGLFFSGPITTILGAGNTAVSDQVETYVKIILLGAPIFILNIAIAFFVRNDGRPTLSMVGMFLSIAVDITFNLIFVGFMDMGVDGAALSTVLGQGVSIIVISSHFFSSKNTLGFSFVFDSSVFRIIKNGFSSALNFIYQFVTIIVLNHYVVSKAGASGVVIYTVVFNLCTVSLAVFEGLSQTIQPMVSVFYGEGSNKKIKGSVKLAIFYAFVICSGIMIVLEVFPQIVPYIFGIADVSLIEQASLAVRIYSTSMFIMTVNVIIGYYLQSVELGTMASILISLRSCVFLLIGAFVLGEFFGINGIWASYFVSEVLTFIVFIVLDILTRKKLLKKGIYADIFFLNKEVEKSTLSFIFNNKSDDFICFKNEILTAVESIGTFTSGVSDVVIEYISNLKTATINGLKQYVEVELISLHNKVIIRDNINHSFLNVDFSSFGADGIETEYGPVLGLSRICIKGADRNE